ncbi:hypothetical protein ACFSTC_16670 [Nonomuraea ferruginea]
MIHLPPDESWVTLGYLGRDGIAHELREPWRVTDNPPPFADAGALTEAAVSQGLDLGTDAISRALRMLYVPRTLTAEIADAAGTDAPGADLPTSMPAVLQGAGRGDPVGDLRPHPRVHLQHQRPRRVRRRVRPARRPAAAGRARGGRAGQRRRAHPRRRVPAADADAAPDHARADPVRHHAAERADLRAARGEPDRADRPRAVVPVHEPGPGDRRRPLGWLRHHPPRPGPTPSASAITARSC